MKIVTVVFGLSIGGTERAAVNFATAYKSLGYDSRVLITGSTGPRKEELDANSIPTYFLDSTSLAFLSEWKPDLVHLHSHLLLYQDVLLILDAVGPASIVETNVFSEPSPWESKLKYSFQLSEWCQRLYLARGGNPKIARVIPNPIAVGNFKVAEPELREQFRDLCSFSSTDLVFGRIGQPSEVKWHPFVVETFNRLCTECKNARLLLVGAPNSILEHVIQSPYRHRIHCHQTISGNHELSVAYSSIDIFLHISAIGESFGMVLAESLICETPVVTLATPWADNSQGEVVGHEIGGFVATTANGLFQGCRKLALDKQLRLRMGKAGARYVASKYDSIHVSRSVVALARADGYEHSPYSAAVAGVGLKSEPYGLLTSLLLASPRLKKYAIYTTKFYPIRPALLAKARQLLNSIKMNLRSAKSL
jgi:glycosyltransferase involved in cell wall biosynthesis